MKRKLILTFIKHKTPKRIIFVIDISTISKSLHVAKFKLAVETKTRKRAVSAATTAL